MAESNTNAPKVFFDGQYLGTVAASGEIEGVPADQPPTLTPDLAWVEMPLTPLSVGDVFGPGEAFLVTSTVEFIPGPSFVAAIEKLIDQRTSLLADVLVADPEEASLVRAVLLGHECADLVYADWLLDRGREDQSWRVRYALRSVVG